MLMVSVRCGKERDVMKSDQTVQCDVLTYCAQLYMLYERVFCSHFPSVVGKFISRQPKLALNSDFSSSNCYGPNLLTRTNATSLPEHTSVTIHNILTDLTFSSSATEINMVKG